MLLNLLQHHPLFKECIEAIDAVVLPFDESDKISELFEATVPLTEWGKVDWDKIDKKVVVGYDQKAILPSLKALLDSEIVKSVFIEWSTGGLPVIKADLDAVIAHFNDVISVAHEKFIFNFDQGYIIEIRFGGSITAGLVPALRIAEKCL